MADTPDRKRKCWLCGEKNATIKTKPELPDNKSWWYCEKCYWKMQELLYD